MNLAIKYTLFAIVATFANILAQDLSIRLHTGQNAILLSIAIGTGAGLILKY